MLAAGLHSGPANEDQPEAPEELAADFPQLEILGLLGRGGMGVVYKVRQPSLDRLAALKILSPRLAAGDPRFAERFSREARALARLSHQNVVTVYDFGTVNGRAYLLMELVEGTTLREVLRGGPMKPVEALAIIPRLCDALEYAHGEGIVHRDIKPENILIDRRGRTKIADFGLAKLFRAGDAESGLTESGAVMGTVRYMAPEQFERPNEVDQRADVYALGVVLYEMLTGEVPAGHFAPPSEKAHVDVRLDEVVLRALQREPEKRYQNVGDVRTDLEALGKAPPRQEGKPPAADSEPAGPTRLSRMAAAAVLLYIPVVVWSATLYACRDMRWSAHTAMGLPEVLLLAAIPAGLLALLGFGLGIVAAVRIRSSRGRLRGASLAAAAIVGVPALPVMYTLKLLAFFGWLYFDTGSWGISFLSALLPAVIIGRWIVYLCQPGAQDTSGNFARDCSLSIAVLIGVMAVGSLLRYWGRQKWELEREVREQVAICTARPSQAPLRHAPTFALVTFPGRGDRREPRVAQEVDRVPGEFGRRYNHWRPSIGSSRDFCLTYLGERRGKTDRVADEYHMDLSDGPFAAFAPLQHKSILYFGTQASYEMDGIRVMLGPDKKALESALDENMLTSGQAAGSSGAAASEYLPDLPPPTPLPEDIARRVRQSLPITKDLTILSYLPDWNHGEVDNLAVAENDGGVRALMDWDPIDPELVNDPSVRFVLAVYSRKTTLLEPAPAIQVRPIAEAWSESSSWRTQPGTDPAGVSGTKMEPGPGWKLFNVDRLVRAQAKDSARHGVELRCQNETRGQMDWSGYGLVSREGMGRWAPGRPQLLALEREPGVDMVATPSPTPGSP